MYLFVEVKSKKCISGICCYYFWNSSCSSLLKSPMQLTLQKTFFDASPKLINFFPESVEIHFFQQLYIPLKSFFFTSSKVYTKYIDHSDLKMLLKNGFFRKYWVYTADILKKYSVYTEYSCGAVRHGSRYIAYIQTDVGWIIQDLANYWKKIYVKFNGYRWFSVDISFKNLIYPWIYLEHGYNDGYIHNGYIKMA